MDQGWAAITAVATAVYTVATIALVIATIANVRLVRRYTGTTKLMVEEARATREAQVAAVEEMRRAREADIRPVLIPYAEATDIVLHQMRWGVKNVGRGPALQIDVRIGYGGKWWHRLQSPALLPGEVRFVRVPSDPQKDHIQYADLHEGHHIQLAGTYHDVSGRRIEAEGQVPFIDEWTALAYENLVRMVERDLGLPPAGAPPPDV